MADVSISISDAGLAAGASVGVKGRAEPGAGKDKSSAGEKGSVNFEQLVAANKKDPGEDGDKKKAEKADDAGLRPPSRPGSATWLWPGQAELSVSDKFAINDETSETQVIGEGGQSSKKAVKAPAGTAPGNAAAKEIAAVPAVGWAGQVEQSEAPASINASFGKHAQAAAGSLPSQAQAPGERASTTSAQAGGAQRDSLPREASPAIATASHASGAPMQHGIVEPAAVRLAAVLTHGRDIGKRVVETERTRSEAPPKIHVTLAETHFSPVKPDAELEAYDLARRMHERFDRASGRSPVEESQRLQAGMRSDRAKGSASVQGDVRAELLGANVARPGPGDVGEQIGARIVQELEQSRASTETRGPGPVHVKQSDPVLRILEIRLEPKELGTVVVRMTLQDNVLNVELGFGKSDAAAAIAKSTDQLSSYLRASGYDVDSIIVRVVDADRAPIPVLNAVSGADTVQGQNGQSTGASSSTLTGQSFAQEGERQPATRDDQLARQNSREGSHGQDGPQPRSSGDLFV